MEELEEEFWLEQERIRREEELIREIIAQEDYSFFYNEYE